MYNDICIRLNQNSNYAKNLLERLESQIPVNLWT